MPTFESELMREARGLARLERRRRSLKGELREVEKAIKASQRVLRALARTKAAEQWDESGAASKVLGLPAGGK